MKLKRFHIIDPIIRRLGYGEPNKATYLHLEEQLETHFITLVGNRRKIFPSAALTIAVVWQGVAEVSL